MVDGDVYLAGPIQHTDTHGKGWREWLKAERDDFTWVDPLEKYDTMAEAEAEWTVEDIVEDDLRMIDDADALLVHWELVPTAGTPMEIFYAAQICEKPAVVQTKVHESDLSPWVTYHADTVAESFDDAINALEVLLSPADVTTTL
jgi:nucleoside 2-deoxyribosyltransferase